MPAISPGSPIAAASSYSSVSTGYEDWIEVLSVSPEGIEVNTWSGQINGWLELAAHPPAFANVIGSKNVTNEIFGDLAVTATGVAFAVVSSDNGSADTIESWQVEDDTVTWSHIGTVSWLDEYWST